MIRFSLAIALALAPYSSAFAQDMPLSQILIDGEGWKKVKNPGDKPAPKPFAATHSADRATMYIALPGDPFLWAGQAPLKEPVMGSTALPAHPYAPLRTRRASERST
jgi:hypothetical protein